MNSRILFLPLSSANCCDIYTDAQVHVTLSLFYLRFYDTVMPATILSLLLPYGTVLYRLDQWNKHHVDGIKRCQEESNIMYVRSFLYPTVTIIVNEFYLVVTFYMIPRTQIHTYIHTYILTYIHTYILYHQNSLIKNIFVPYVRTQLTVPGPQTMYPYATIVS